MSDTKEQAKQAKERGNAAYQAGKYEDAVREFSQAIELDPTDAVFFSNRSMSFASAGNYEAALRDGKKAMELKPDWPKAYSRAGFALYKLSRYEEAKKVYEQGLQHAPQDQGLKDAVKDCEEAISSRDPLGSMGNMFAEKNWDKLRANPSTRELLNDPTVVNNLRMLEKNPNFLSGFFQDPKMSKIISVLMGLPEDLFTKAGAAREKSQQNSGGSNTNTNTNSSSSAADMDEDDAEELETETKTFTRSAPEPKSESSKPSKQPEPEPEPQNEEERQQREQKKKAVAAKDRGNDLFKAKKFEQALAAYTEAIELDPTDSTFYSNRAAVYYQMKDFEKSVHECNEAIRVGREHRAPYTQVAKTFFRLGETYRAMDRLDEAVAAYERSLLEHNDFKVKKTMKEVQEIKKKRDDEAYINPALSEEHKNKGNALFQEAKWVDAIAEYSEALRRDPKNYKVRSNRALCYTKLMDWNRGLADCEEILKVDPKFIKAYLRKGKIQHFLKQYHKALDTFSAGLTIDPNHEELMQAKRETMAAVNAEMGGGVDPARAQAAMSDPEIKNILRDPTINKVLQDLQNDPRAGQAAMRDPDIRAKIEKLITAGVLRVER